MPHLGSSQRNFTRTLLGWQQPMTQYGCVSPQLPANSLSYLGPCANPRLRWMAQAELFVVGKPGGKLFIGQLDSNIISSAPLLAPCLANTQGQRLQRGRKLNGSHSLEVFCLYHVWNMIVKDTGLGYSSVFHLKSDMKIACQIKNKQKKPIPQWEKLSSC